MTKALWIGKDNAPASSGKTFETYDPSTGEVLDELARGDKEDVDNAVAAATSSFESGWGKLSNRKRSKILWRIGELIEQNVKALAELESADAGKPIKNTRRADIPLSAETFQYFAGWASKIHGQTIPVATPHLNYTMREPIGVVGAITPWNFPLLLAARKVAAALAAGNTVVLKPPEEASLTCLELGRLALEAGAPPGTLNVVTGYGEEAGAALVAHPGVGKIAFTGSTEVGKLIQRSAADTLKRVSLELGGKCPNIVFADADLDKAIPGAVRAAYYNNGQVCTAGSRLLVEDAIHDQVVEGVIEGAKKLKRGAATDPKTDLGPLVSKAQHDRVVGYIDKGGQEGASCVVGGTTASPGWFVDATVFDGVESSMVIAQEEIFGPVVSVIRFSDVEAAARIADATPYGLAAGIWTKDVSRAHRLASQLRAGTVWINSYNMYDSASPYGGMKASGFGRENGEAVMHEMTESKSIWVAL